MRIAVVSDIHGNLTALEAVLHDMRQTSPDLILHGGDLVASGSSSAEVVDCVRNLGWNGVLGNTDEMLFRPKILQEFASQSTQGKSLFTAIAEIADATRAQLGEERLVWLSALPFRVVHPPLALVHASPESCWRSPGPNAEDDELISVYRSSGPLIAIYGHIHQSFVREMDNLTVINTGSVSLSYDGDPRASYLLLDNGKPEIRRVEYDLEREIQAISQRRIPHADWIARTLRTARPQRL